MPETEPKVDKKADAEAEKRAAERAKRDAADVETFLSFHRGETLLRGENGSFDPVAYVAEQAALDAKASEKE